MVPRAGGSVTEQAKQTVEQKAHEAKPWVERLARLGYGAKGIVSIVVGWLAVQAAMGPGGKTTNAQGALGTIAQQPFGKFLLGVVAVGLFGYALWRFVQAALDPEHTEKDAKTLAKRVGYAISGLAYGGLALTAFQIVRGAGGGNKATTQDWTARLLAQPLGQWLVAAIGLVVIGVGINTLFIAFKEKFRDKLKLAEMSPAQEAWATRIGKIGLMARAVVSFLIGGFLIQAAFHANPNEARGLDGALKVLAQQSFGPWVLGTVAAGLVAYGIYALVEARYRRIMGA